MKKKTSKAGFKAVEFMRKRRDELSELYSKNPQEFRKQLESIRKKYKHKFHQREKHPA